MQSYWKQIGDWTSVGLERSGPEKATRPSVFLDLTSFNMLPEIITLGKELNLLSKVLM